MKFGTKSWRAWILSFMMEFGSYQLLMKNKATLTQLERDELTRRSLLLYYYFLRNPVYDLVSK